MTNEKLQYCSPSIIYEATITARAGSDTSSWPEGLINKYYPETNWHEIPEGISEEEARLIDILKDADGKSLKVEDIPES